MKTTEQVQGTKFLRSQIAVIKKNTDNNYAGLRREQRQAYKEVVPFLEGPLSEVPLYSCSPYTATPAARTTQTRVKPRFASKLAQCKLQTKYKQTT